MAHRKRLDHSTYEIRSPYPLVSMPKSRGVCGHTLDAQQNGGGETTLLFHVQRTAHVDHG